MSKLLFAPLRPAVPHFKKWKVSDRNPGSFHFLHFVGFGGAKVRFAAV
jgi:hypothetical protein